MGKKWREEASTTIAINLSIKSNERDDEKKSRYIYIYKEKEGEERRGEERRGGEREERKRLKPKFLSFPIKEPFRCNKIKTRNFN